MFLDFSVFTRFETRREGELTVLVWRDLRFADRRTDGFLCEVKVDAAGRIVSDRETLEEGDVITVGGRAFTFHRGQVRTT